MSEDRLASTKPGAANIQTVFSAGQISARIGGLAEEIGKQAPANLLVVAILKGSFIFAADLIRALHAGGLHPEVDFLMLSSYGAGTRSSGQIAVLRDVEVDLTGRWVLLVDDVLESGRTLAHAKAMLDARGVERVATCILLDKPVTRAQPITPDFTGFACPNTFVVGYGMDLDHKYRELPFIGRIVQDSAPT